LNITIHLPAVLRTYSGSTAKISLVADSVRAALEEIERLHPSLYRSVCDDTGAIRRHVNLFVNCAEVRDRQGLETALVPGDVVTILPAVSGV